MNKAFVIGIMVCAFLTGVMALGFVMSYPHAAEAQDSEAASPAPPPPSSASKSKASGEKKKTNIDFEDELVEGELKKPELFYLLQKKQFNFRRLIKLRENFLPEMRRDGDEIRRGRSKN
jgi:hypothetical protein